MDELARLRQQSQALRSRVDDEDEVKKQLGWTKVKEEKTEEPSCEEKKDEKKDEKKEEEAKKTVDRKPASEEPPVQKPACNRRQSAMLLNRLRKNPKRQEALPASLREKLAKEDDDSVSDLISELIEHGGDLQELCSSYERQVVKEVSSQELTNSAPYTELELIQKYGERAKDVMKEKEASGDWAEDPNLRGSKIFYLSKTERNWGSSDIDRQIVGARTNVHRDDLPALKDLMRPEPSALKRRLGQPSSSSAPSPSPSVPSTPATADPKGVPSGEKDTRDPPAPKKPKKKTLENMTVLDKGEDLAKKALAGSTLAAKLKTEMEANPYGKDLLKDLANAESNFKCPARTYTFSRRELFSILPHVCVAHVTCQEIVQRCEGIVESQSGGGGAVPPFREAVRAAAARYGKAEASS
ncbi:unnamed protein product [Symbiodinium sp. CCMP2592]|nr:unnamed protein product [Symbiodinium sp. CCMP2592]CAE7827071.1 unnamed protein product [Symbiodinium sp. CCMP2592]